ncbi:MAG: hypothetical protein BMS9Abin12_0013 [Acidimicrobiia bacterium]|nr:MAG: hypothetical protein BMS9Abin12_0013 [Acidimicrobiia bacterium]
MTSLRRTVFVGTTALLMMASFTNVVSASELDDVLKEARDSTYTASRLVVSVWGDQTQVSREFVERADGMEMVRKDTSWSMTGNGKTVSMGDEPAGITFLAHQRDISTSRYTIVRRGKVSHMSRPCQIVEVMEGDILRASFIVDDRSGALLLQELYAENGDLYRRTTLSDFRAYRTYEAPSGGSEVPTEVVMSEDSVLLPDTIAGYQLVDAFSAPGGSEQGFYTDGLFRFSLFFLGGNTVVSGFEDSMTFVTETGLYEMVPTAQAVRLYWRDGSNRYVLVGDLPPDHVADVLSELPIPRSRGMWSRWWSLLFG